MRNESASIGRRRRPRFDRLRLAEDEIINHRDIVVWRIVLAERRAAVLDPHPRDDRGVEHDAEERETFVLDWNCVAAKRFTAGVEILEPGVRQINIDIDRA